MQFSCDGFLSTTKFVIAAKAAFHFGDTYIDQSHTSIDNAVAKERKKRKTARIFMKDNFATVGSGGVCQNTIGVSFLFVLYF